MKTVLVTVSDDRFGRKGGRYSDTQDKIERIFRSNLAFGISDFRMWKREDIVASSFYQTHEIPAEVVREDVKHPITGSVVLSAGTEISTYKLLDMEDPSKNGRVYKPLVIRDTLKTLDYGDFLIYTDCSPEMWNMDESYRIDLRQHKLEVIQRLCTDNGGILTAHVKWNHRVHVEKGFVGFHTHENFTTNRCMERMGLSDYKYSLQHASGMIVIQKSAITMQFAEDWLYWNSIPDCGCMGPLSEPLMWYNEVMINGKIGHRHDQSVSGLLLNKMDKKIIETLDYYERPAGVSPYLFLNFCKTDYKYNFFDSNQPMGKIRHTMVSPDGNPNSDGNWYIEINDRQ
jgi:hypothetical protein